MRILGHIHTFNDEEVIDRSVHALLDQTCPVEAVVVVDNASTDRTLERTFPGTVTVIRHARNLGTNGAVISGLRYALNNQYDWIWVFDADSAPHKHALATLLQLYQSLPQKLQQEVWALVAHSAGIVFSNKGFEPVQPKPDRLFYECDASVWTGSLFRLAAVQKIGLPSPDYVLDIGEYAFGYRAKLCGYKCVVYQGTLMEHNIGGRNIPYKRYRLGPASFNAPDLPAIRYYYVVRNSLFFWLREYRDINIAIMLRILRSLCLLTGSAAIIFLRAPRKGWAGLVACLRGWSDGLRGNMHRRY